MTATIGFNHLFIESRPLTGPGYYAVELLENMLRLLREREKPLVVKVFAQQGTGHHYSAEARQHLIEVPTGNRFVRVAWEQVLLPGRARRERIDLLFSPGFVSPLFGAPVKAAAIHDMYYRVVPEAVERFQRRYWKAMLPLTARACDLILTVSQSSRRDIERYLPAANGKVLVTPLASRFDPQLSHKEPTPRADPPFVLMIANLTRNKNVGRVVEALSILRAQSRDVGLIHIGSDHCGELARAVDTFGLADRVQSLGKVDDPSLVSVARESLCIAVPSLYEGFGLPAIEAHALGAPVICSDRGSLPEVVGDAALIFDPEDARAIAKCITRLLDDPGLRSDLRWRGLENARQFSWQSTATQTLDAFERLLNRQRPSGG